MLIFDINDQPTIIDNIYGPTLTDYYWVLDLNILDFKLAPLTVLEEIVCPSLEIMINGVGFVLPASWNILVFDRDTSQLDVVEISQAAGKEFTALVYGPRKTSPQGLPVNITRYFMEHKNVGPSLNKHQMLCHPVGPKEWVCVSPSDIYNKYLKERIVGDII